MRRIGGILAPRGEPENAFYHNFEGNFLVPGFEGKLDSARRASAFGFRDSEEHGDGREVLLKDLAALAAQQKSSS